MPDNRDHHCHIVHFDDNPRDLELMQLAFDAADVAKIAYSGITVPAEGVKQPAEDFKFRPSIILLDLNMPEMNGLEILAQWRNDPGMKKTSVIVLTTSSNPTEHKQCLALGATAILSKPLSFAKLVEVAKAILSYC
jgi:chemotaxis family two-component system response regulator Rcp1